jgi:hypothetical protein
MPRRKCAIRVRLRHHITFSLVNGCTLRRRGAQPELNGPDYGVAEPTPDNRRHSQFKLQRLQMNAVKEIFKARIVSERIKSWFYF